jgi:hypothetical protein
MDALKRAFKWDEGRFGLEYDLDIYMIVAVGDFYIGGLEKNGFNKVQYSFRGVQDVTLALHLRQIGVCATYLHHQYA